MPSEPVQPSNAGIVTDETGERHIPESVRADGTTRKAIKIRPGYRPPEDVEVYKNRTAEAFRDRGRRIGIPGAAGTEDEKTEEKTPSSSNKNAKRREARRKAKASEESGGAEDAPEGPKEQQTTEEVDPQAEKEKKARGLRKKLKQAKDLQSKKEGGESLLPEQIAKVIKINELVRELEALGFDADGEAKPAQTQESSTETSDHKDD